MSTIGPVCECVALIITFAPRHAAGAVDRGACVFDEIARRGDQVECDERRGRAPLLHHDGLGVELVMDALGAPFRVIPGHRDTNRRSDRDRRGAGTELAG